MEFLLPRLDFFIKRPCNEVMKTKRVAIYVRVQPTSREPKVRKQNCGNTLEAAAEPTKSTGIRARAGRRVTDLN
jgi:hypothetical protein